MTARIDAAIKASAATGVAGVTTVRATLLAAALVLTGCASAPPTSVNQPMTARPAPPPEIVAVPGSIFQAGSSRGLFDDRRARHIGDTLTINIVERNTASTQSSSKSERTSAASANVGAITGLPGKSLIGLGFDAGSDSSFDGSGESAANNVFTGTITVTVTDVLHNGNLIVSGEKQVAINQGNEFIRFSGVINPATVTTSNTVNSSQVADARIEYKGSGYINESQQMGWLARFFLNISPF